MELWSLTNTSFVFVSTWRRRVEASCCKVATFPASERPGRIPFFYCLVARVVTVGRGIVACSHS